MHKQIFINLSVKDLPRTKEFWSSLGYSFEPKCTNDQGACVVLGDNLFVMLLVEEFFAGFTNKPISDAHERTEVLNCLSCESREHVDSLVAKAKAAGATMPKEPIDHGFMYVHGFHDIDGHCWELVHMVAEDECKQICQI